MNLKKINDDSKTMKGLKRFSSFLWDEYGKYLLGAALGPVSEIATATYKNLVKLGNQAIEDINRTWGLIKLRRVANLLEVEEIRTGSDFLIADPGFPINDWMKANKANIKLVRDKMKVQVVATGSNIKLTNIKLI